MCRDCKHIFSRRLYTPDSFEYVVDLVCTLNKNKKIKGSVEWTDSPPVEIPDGCLLKGEINA